MGGTIAAKDRDVLFQQTYLQYIPSVLSHSLASYYGPCRPLKWVDLGMVTSLLKILLHDAQGLAWEAVLFLLRGKTFEFLLIDYVQSIDCLVAYFSLLFSHQWKPLWHQALKTVKSFRRKRQGGAAAKPIKVKRDIYGLPVNLKRQTCRGGTTTRPFNPLGFDWLRVFVEIEIETEATSTKLHWLWWTRNNFPLSKGARLHTGLECI